MGCEHGTSQRVNEAEDGACSICLREENARLRADVLRLSGTLAQVVEILNDLDSEDPLPFVWRALAAAKGE